MGGLLEEIGTTEAIRTAWKKVRANGGSAGIDRVTVGQFARDLERNLEQIAAQVQSGGYRFAPVMRMRPSFLRTADRALVVPTVRDRIVQRAIADFLYPRIDPVLSPSCRAFRKGRPLVSSVEDVGRWIATGSVWVVRADIKKFFDNIRPDHLLELLTPFVDPGGIRFLGRIIRGRVFDRDHIADMVVGIPQGSPLSPVLANLYLNDLDHAIRERHPKYLRYCDDLIVLENGENDVRKALAEIIAGIDPIGLSLNEQKTRVCRVEDGFVFLGFQYGAAGRGPAVKAIEALRFRLREILSTSEPDLAQLDALYRGWTNYFGLHPECWLDSPAGVLALLRVHQEAERDELVEKAASKRWKLETKAPEGHALCLAEEWMVASRPEQAWLELAAAHGGSDAAMSDVERWAKVLDVPETSLRNLLRVLVGTAEGRLTALVEAVAEIGRYETAQKLSAFGPEVLEGPGEADEEVDVALLSEEADYPMLLDWFQGREGVHSLETVSGSHRRFVPVHRPLAAEDWRAHLEGGKTLGLPLIRADQTVLLAVLDIDICRKDLDLRMGIPDELMGRALGAALRLRRELGDRQCSSLLELSGHKGFHLWIRLAGPAPARSVRMWLHDVVTAAGELPEGVRVEVFPTRDKVKQGVGPLVKLPLGIHSKTGRRCDVLDERGEPVPDPFETLRSIPRLSRGALTGALHRPSDDEPARDEADSSPSFGPRARQMIERCHVLRFLSDKALQSSYLTHVERSLLRCTLGHLGEEGTDAIHIIISRCYNYRRDVTDRHLRKTPPSPISCPRVREIHAQITASVGCDCRFRLRGKGYPTPVLHALKQSEIPAFVARGRQASEKKAGEDAAEEKRSSNELRREAEALVKKIADRKQQLRGLKASIERLRHELESLFERVGSNRIELSIGVLHRVKSDGDDGWDYHIEV